MSCELANLGHTKHTVWAEGNMHVDLAPTLGRFNGYVVVGREHPLFGINFWDDLDSEQKLVVYDYIQVHGGITWSSKCGPNGWMFGFDTSHISSAPFSSMESVIVETRRFAAQLERMQRVLNSPAGTKDRLFLTTPSTRDLVIDVEEA